MQKLFNNILVPISLDKDTKKNVEKAIHFANHSQCNLHLIHIPIGALLSFNGSLISASMKAKTVAEKKKRVCELQSQYCKEMEKPLILSVHVECGKAEEVMAAYVALHQIDLVFATDKRKSFPFASEVFNASALAGKTQCPVLSLHSVPDLLGVKIIVMPVGRNLPISKIRIAAYLAKKYNASIHLVTQERNALMYEELAYMEKALRVLKDNTDLPVKCKTLVGESLGNIALSYAEQVKADLIVVNSGAESFLPGIANRLFSRFVFNESKIPVMTVALTTNNN
jgi:nucleotide-binding universal stress UspA family protein